MNLTNTHSTIHVSILLKQIMMKLVSHYIKDSEEHKSIHGSGDVQDLHGLMDSIMVMVITMEDTSVSGICIGGSIGELLKVTNTKEDLNVQ